MHWKITRELKIHIHYFHLLPLSAIILVESKNRSSCVSQSCVRRRNHPAGPDR